MKCKVLVTGASGFVGSHVAEHLAHQEAELRVLRRLGSESRAFALPFEQAEIAYGDLRDQASLDAAVSGVNAVVHCAALVRDFGPAQDFDEVNVRGTHNLIEASLRAGVERFVYLSSPSVVFSGHDQIQINEDTPYPKHPLGNYARSKAEAERALIAVAQQTEMHCTVLRPHAVWGPRDAQGYFPKLLSRFYRGKLPRLAPERRPQIDLCHVDNVSRAVACALTQPGLDSGGVFFITDGQALGIWDWVDQLCAIFDMSAPKINLPFTMVMSLATGAEWWHRIFGKKETEPRLSPYAVSLLTHSTTYDISRARRELGYQPGVDRQQALIALKKWIDDLGGVEAYLHACGFEH